MLGNSPVNMSFTVNPEKKQGPIRFGFDTKRWYGQPISVLAHFPQIEPFFQAVKRCAALHVDCSLWGNDLLGATIQADSLGSMKRVADFLAVLSKARSVACHYGVNPPLPPDFGPAHGREIEQLYQLMKDGEYRRKMPGARITLHPPRAGVKRLLANAKNVGGPLEICPIEDQREPFLGIDVNVGKIKHIWTKTKLATRLATLKARLAHRGRKSIPVEFAALPTCEYVIQAVEQEPVKRNSGDEMGCECEHTSTEPPTGAGELRTWDQINARRIELAEKEVEKGLTPAETAEFNRLQTSYFQYLEKKHPSPPVDMDRLHCIEARLNANEEMDGDQ